MAVIKTGIPNQNLSIVKSGAFDFVRPANQTFWSVDIAHGLSYTPVYLAWDLINGLVRPLPSVTIELTGSNAGKVAMIQTMSADDTNISLRIEAPNYASNTYYSSTITVLVVYDLLSELITE